MAIAGGKGFWWPLAACAALAALFLIWPELDLIVSGYFYDGQAFYWQRAIPFIWFSEYVGFLAAALVLVPLALSFSKAPALTLAWRQRLYLILVLAIGSGLIVNEAFKNNWGRARPRQIVEFGGERQFTPAWVIADQCPRNCSFTSGDASVGFFLFAYMFLYRRCYRWWLSATLLVGGTLGLTRIVQGAHFLSDTIFTAFAMYFTASILRRLAQVSPDAP